MPLNFITADMRMAREPGIKLCVLGPSGIGKTTLLRTLAPESTLFVDAEAGDLAVDGWQGLSIDVRRESNSMTLHPWIFLKHMAVWMSGPDPAADKGADYSEAHYKTAVAYFGDPASMENMKTIFFDSITVASRMCFAWCLQQPQARAASGAVDTRGAYGLLGIEMVALLTQLQHVRGRNMIFVGILDQEKDDYGRKLWVPQIVGAATAKALPGIVDQVVSMVEMQFEDGSHRAFVCHTLNEWGYPAKDRSGQLDCIEEPHLGRLMEKIRAPRRAREMVYHVPTNPPITETQGAVGLAGVHDPGIAGSIPAPATIQGQGASTEAVGATASPISAAGENPAPVTPQYQ